MLAMTSAIACASVSGRSWFTWSIYPSLPIPSTAALNCAPMPPENRLTLARARDAREKVIAALQEHFAHDALDVDEFERRVTLAHTREAPEEIEALVADLPPLAAGAVPAARPATKALV